MNHVQNAQLFSTVVLPRIVDSCAYLEVTFTTTIDPSSMTQDAKYQLHQGYAGLAMLE